MAEPTSGTTGNSHPDRRELLKLGGAALLATAAGLSRPRAAAAETPKRGGTFRVSLASEPLGFDPHLTPAASTFAVLSCTHSCLFRYKAGPSVRPGSFTLEGDLAESWVQPTETTYVVTLRKGVRWHDKPPANGRELSADDVVFTYERFLSVKGNPNRVALDYVEKVEALDRHRVRFTLKEPMAWFLDFLASLSTCIVAREAVERFGDLRAMEACIGTGPWMMERYQRGVGATLVRHPHYFRAGLPNADGVELIVKTDVSARLATWLAGGYDFAPESGMVVVRNDFDLVRRKKPGLQTAEMTWLVNTYLAMRLDQEPFRDIRVRHALALANSGPDLLASNPYAQGHGRPNPTVPAALRDWSLPIGELTESGRRLYEHDPAAAKRLLAQAGYPSGIKVTLATTAYGPEYIDLLQVMLAHWKAVGIHVDLKLKERGAFFASIGNFEGLMASLRGVSTIPETYLAGFHLTGQRLNTSRVNDEKLTQMIRLQRRTFNTAQRRSIVHDIQRYLAEQAYYLYNPSALAISAWEPYVKNFAPNHGYDYGWRLLEAWLDR